MLHHSFYLRQSKKQAITTWLLSNNRGNESNDELCFLSFVQIASFQESLSLPLNLVSWSKIKQLYRDPGSNTSTFRWEGGIKVCNWKIVILYSAKPSYTLYYWEFDDAYNFMKKAFTSSSSQSWICPVNLKFQHSFLICFPILVIHAIFEMVIDNDMRKASPKGWSQHH